MATEKELKAAMALDAASSDEETPADDEHVEMLVTGRAKRATAGNRMTSMVAEIAADDDLELLFAEDEEDEPDEEFQEEAEEADFDNDMGDSSDDEDHGPAAGADDLDGEKEIEKQAKEDRKRKRKAQQAFTRPSKKIKHVPGATKTAPAPKAKNKKVERLTWMPVAGEATRHSRRQATTAQSEALKTRIEVREEERKLLAGKLAAAAARREQQRANLMTQEQHLAEAAQVEKENSKSLNRWEAMERERQEEQRARLAALQNRQLTGPVVSHWSGPARWLGEKLSAVGTPKIKEVELKEIARAERDKEREEKQRQKDEKERQKEAERKEAGIENGPTEQSVPPHPGENSQIDSQEPITASTSATNTNTLSAEARGASQQSSTDEITHRPKSQGSIDPQPSSHSQAPTQTASPQPAVSRENGINDLLPELMQAAASDDQSKTPEAATVPTIKQESVPQSGSMATIPATLSDPTLQPKPQPTMPQQIVFSVEPGSSLSTQTSKKISAVPPSQMNVINLASIPTEQPTAPAGPPPPPPKPEIAARNLVSLLNVELGGRNDSSVISSLPHELKDSILVAKTAKAKKGPTKPPAVPVCPVTGLPAMYKDPTTGVGYNNSYAYKQLQNVAEGRLRWSELAGCYMNAAVATPAQGVPEGFTKILAKTSEGGETAV